MSSVNLKRKRMSGLHYKKNALEKQTEEQLKRKIAKLDTYFK